MAGLGDDQDGGVTVGAVFLTLGIFVGVLTLLGPCLAGLFVRLFCCSPCCACCKRRLLDEPGTDGDMVRVGNEKVQATLLKKKKELLTSYMLMTTVGWTGAHHFYLDRLVHGTCCVWSMNFCFLGFLIDFFMMPVYVNTANKGSAAVARHDGSACNICWKLPCLFFFIVLSPLTGILYFPSVLHGFQVVDLHKGGAGTEQNPYEMLGVQPGVPAPLLDVTFKTKMLVLQSQRPCDSECKAEQKELQKAFDFVSGATYRKYKVEKDRKEAQEKRKKEGRRKDRKAQDEERKKDAWSDWGSYKMYEWDILSDIFKEKSSDWVKDPKTSDDAGFEEGSYNDEL